MKEWAVAEHLYLLRTWGDYADAEVEHEVACAGSLRAVCEHAVSQDWGTGGIIWVHSDPGNLAYFAGADRDDVMEVVDGAYVERAVYRQNPNRFTIERVRVAYASDPEARMAELTALRDWAEAQIVALDETLKR